MIVTQKTEICFRKNKKHCGKRRKCWLPAFSLFPTIFSKAFFSRGVKSRDCVVIVNYLTDSPDFKRALYKKPYENIVGRENAGNQHFLLFPQCFLLFPKQSFNCLVTFILLSANALDLDQPKKISFGKVN